MMSFSRERIHSLGWKGTYFLVFQEEDICHPIAPQIYLYVTTQGFNLIGVTISPVTVYSYDFPVPMDPCQQLCI